MVLLDTNILSALMSPKPHREVVEWLDTQDPVSVFISSVTIAEISYGLESLPIGKRRRQLSDAFERFLTLGFLDRNLDFDYKAAMIYGRLMAFRNRAGRPMSLADGQIAAIAKANGLVLATRNVKDFLDCGLVIVNPYELEGEQKQ
ncbi:MAG: type II toxin-antitoxin system VapC family toxin [Myxococcales bacterium]|nr:type II toxin-antitoxin system VapC family toxin [Myxococcales bacterium]